MANTVVPINGGQVVAPIDHFALAFAPARPTLDALAKLRKVRTYLAERERYDPKRNYAFGDLSPTELLALLPDAATLQHAKQLFEEAQHVPAPEEWYFLALGAMLAAMPNSGKVPVDYTFGLVNSILNDDDLHRGYREMGFSFAVVVLAIREVRRECKFVPSAQEVLEACQKHRRAFRDLIVDLEVMISVREHAEVALQPPKPRWGPQVDPDEAPLPF